MCEKRQGARREHRAGRGGAKSKRAAEIKVGREQKEAQGRKCVCEGETWESEQPDQCRCTHLEWNEPGGAELS